MLLSRNSFFGSRKAMDKKAVCKGFPQMCSPEAGQIHTRLRRLPAHHSNVLFRNWSSFSRLSSRSRSSEVLWTFILIFLPVSALLRSLSFRFSSSLCLFLRSRSLSLSLCRRSRSSFSLLRLFFLSFLSALSRSLLRCLCLSPWDFGDLERERGRCFDVDATVERASPCLEWCDRECDGPASEELEREEREDEREEERERDRERDKRRR